VHQDPVQGDRVLLVGPPWDVAGRIQVEDVDRLVGVRPRPPKYSSSTRDGEERIKAGVVGSG
jgi:hypothetical protein